MKAIETRYKGYRFRSRLEARWAVLFDSWGLPWEFEPEGYVTGAGHCYLPDFKIGQRLYVEIKPAWAADVGILPTLRREREKWGGFLAGDPENELLVFFGPPTPDDRGLPGIRYYDDHRVERIRLLECRRCESVAWATYGFMHDGDAAAEPQGYGLRCKPTCSSERSPVFGARIRAAVDASRSARFEHGESGAG